MKTQLFLIGAVSLLGTSLFTTSYAADRSEYLHFTRHRDSNGNLLMGPTQHQAEPSVMQKTMVPSQPKTFEQRSTDWGMSLQEVKDNEPVQSSWELQSPVLADSEQRVAYHTQIEGIEAGLTYTFYQDHLGQAKYVFEPQHEDAAEFVNDFHTVENWIRQSYGEPTSVQQIWLDDLYQYDKSLWGQAVKRGHLVMVAEWNNPGTDIVLVLDGGDDEVGLVADFTSTTFAVPVSLDLDGQEESVEAAIEETTTQETHSSEALDPMAEEMSGEDMTHDIPVGEGLPQEHETEVASQGPANGEQEIDELEEIEHMLNEEHPTNEPVNDLVEPDKTDHSMDSHMHDELPMNGQPSLSAGEGDQHPTKPTVDVEASEGIMQKSGEASMKSSMEEQVSSAHSPDQHVSDHVMDVESELEEQHL